MFSNLHDKSHYLYPFNDVMYPTGRKTFIGNKNYITQIRDCESHELFSPLNYFVNYLCHLTDEGSKIYDKR